MITIEKMRDVIQMGGCVYFMNSNTTSMKKVSIDNKCTIIVGAEETKLKTPSSSGSTSYNINDIHYTKEQCIESFREHTEKKIHDFKQVWV